jgi:ribonuclease P protein component
MLPDEYRLKKDRDFDILFKEGRFVAGTFVNAKVWRVDTEKYPKRGYKPDDLKIGFAVGTKVSKSAVKRNRVKRQMREVVRLLLKDGRVKSGYHIVFIAKPESVGASYEDISRSIHDVLQKARLVE